MRISLTKQKYAKMRKAMHRILRLSILVIPSHLPKKNTKKLQDSDIEVLGRTETL